MYLIVWNPNSVQVTSIYFSFPFFLFFSSFLTAALKLNFGFLLKFQQCFSFCKELALDYIFNDFKYHFFNELYLRIFFYLLVFIYYFYLIISFYDFIIQQLFDLTQLHRYQINFDRKNQNEFYFVSRHFYQIISSYFIQGHCLKFHAHLLMCKFLSSLELLSDEKLFFIHFLLSCKNQRSFKKNIHPLIHLLCFHRNGFPVYYRFILHLLFIFNQILFLPFLFRLHHYL